MAHSNRNNLKRFFFFGHTVRLCGILVPWPGIEPRPSAVKAWSPYHWTTREFPWKDFNKVTALKSAEEISAVPPLELVMGGSCSILPSTPQVLKEERRLLKPGDRVAVWRCPSERSWAGPWRMQLAWGSLQGESRENKYLLTPLSL